MRQQLTKLIPPHHSYVEPYFGSGVMLFSKSPSAIETINDLDGEVVNLFRCIKTESNRLAALVMVTPYSRQIYNGSYGITPEVEKLPGADRCHRACQFLVRCWQSYGARGSRSDGYKGGWKYDASCRESMYNLWNWYHLPEWIIEVAERLRKVQIESRPALEMIEKFNYKNVFMYLDPPYLLETRSRKQYEHEMTESDHEALLEAILQSRAQIMISGYETEMYNAYLEGWHKEHFASCADGGKPRQETIWMNYTLERQLEIGDIVKEGGNYDRTENAAD